MVDFTLKITFIFLWASAFVAAKFGLNDAGPFSMLAVRFTIVTCIFAALVFLFNSKWPKINEIPYIALVGILLHGFYLGGVFFSIKQGTSAGISSLIVSLHPILTCVLAIFLIKEQMKFDKWLGIFLGFFGVILVVWPRLGSELPLVGFVSCIVALIAISFGTIIQKKYLEKMDILGGNTIQAVFAAVFFSFLLLIVEPFKFHLTRDLFISMTWLILLVSLGAISILMVLIRRGEMSSTASLFFLAPPVSAILGYIVFKEELNALGVIGFVITCTGVWIVNRQPLKNKLYKN
ncbi:MAG: EamA family transporter [Opitutales bacterium]|nr:EamA family transporter [Opitutales bacterium]